MAFVGSAQMVNPLVLLWDWKARLSGCGTRGFILHTEVQTYSA